jgi:hypothetical protein
VFSYSRGFSQDHVLVETNAEEEGPPGAQQTPAPLVRPDLGASQRAHPSVDVGFGCPCTGLLSIFGDKLDNGIVVSRDLAGYILINGGAVSVTGGVPTVANRAGSKRVSLGPRTRLELFSAPTVKSPQAQ